MKRARMLARDLHDDRSGAVLIWVSVMILVIFGFVALAIDGARYLNLNSNMQQIADAAALAGAKELDGSISAMKNATKVAKDYLKNSPNWSDIDRDAGVTTDILTVNFYAAPPDPNGTSTPLPDTREGNQQASYIEVITRPRGLNTTFAVTMGNDEAYADARAVARVGYSVCKPIQSFMCNPWETTEAATDLGKASNFKEPNVDVGDMFLLQAGSSNGPGDWGYISPLVDTNAAASQLELENFWSGASSPTCQPVAVGKQLGPITDPGNDAGRKSVAGMNVRFDVPNTANGAIDNVRAPVVIDGYVINGSPSANSCASTTPASPVFPTYTTSTSQVLKSNGKCCDTITNHDTKTCSFAQVSSANTTGYRNYCNARAASATVPSAPNCKGANTTCSTSGDNCASLTTGTYRIGSCPLPRDPDFGPTATGGIMKGGGADLDDLRAYWSNHHSTGFPSGVTTRYGIYQKELENMASAGAGYFDVQGAGSNAIEPFSTLPRLTNPSSCQKSNIGGVDRRLISVAIVDCNYWGINGKSNRLPTITKNAVFFMTEPATDAYQTGVANADIGRIYGEFVGAYDVNMSGGSVFQQVELVR